MFFDCYVAKFVWNAVYFTFGIEPPRNVTHLLGSWLSGLSTQLRKMMLVEHLHYVGHCGYAGMKLCSKICILTRICRYSTEGFFLGEILVAAI